MPRRGDEEDLVFIPCRSIKRFRKTRNCKNHRPADPVWLATVLLKLSIQPAASQALSAELPETHGLEADMIGLGSLYSDSGPVFGSSNQQQNTARSDNWPLSYICISCEDGCPQTRASRTNQWGHASGLRRGSEKLSSHCAVLVVRCMSPRL